MMSNVKVKLGCTVVIGLIINLSSTFVFAEEDNKNSPANLLKITMQQLAVMAGSWQLQVSITNDNGNSWQAMPAQQVDIDFTHNDLVLAEQPVKREAGGFSMLTYLSYDQYRNVFRKAAIDDVWGVMDLYQGKIIGNQLILDNLTAGTFFPVGPKVWRGFRLTVDLFLQQENGEQFRMMRIEKTDDNGNSWQPAFNAKYTKIT